MKCKCGQSGTCEKLFRPNCPDDGTCYEFDMFTNADRIRAMSDEELAKWIDEFSFCTDACPDSINEVEESIGYCCPANCKEQIMNWLRQPGEGEQHG